MTSIMNKKHMHSFIFLRHPSEYAKFSPKIPNIIRYLLCVRADLSKIFSILVAYKVPTQSTYSFMHHQSSANFYTFVSFVPACTNNNYVTF